MIHKADKPTRSGKHVELKASSNMPFRNYVCVRTYSITFSIHVAIVHTLRTWNRVYRKFIYLIFYAYASRITHTRKHRFITTYTRLRNPPQFVLQHSFLILVPCVDYVIIYYALLDYIMIYLISPHTSTRV